MASLTSSGNGERYQSRGGALTTGGATGPHSFPWRTDDDWMTYDTPDGTDERRLWCPECELSVEPVDREQGSACPACGTDLE